MSGLLAMTLVCTATVATLTEAPEVGQGATIEGTECVGDEITLGLSLGAEIAAIKLTGRREVVSLGATPAVGAALRWTPAGWPIPALGADVVVAMTPIDPSTGGHVRLWLLAQVVPFGILAVGGGMRVSVATREGLDDRLDAVITGGLRVPL